jgi:hypothetical protein
MDESSPHPKYEDFCAVRAYTARELIAQPTVIILFCKLTEAHRMKPVQRTVYALTEDHESRLWTFNRMYSF